MPTRREALTMAAVAVAAAAAGALVGPLALQSQSGAAKLLSAVFPNLSGAPKRISDWRGSVLVCNFWATWCAPCREEVPLLVALRENYAAKGVEVVGIGIDNAAKIRQFSEDYRVTYPLLVADATAMELMRDLGNDAGGLPFTVVYDRQGAIGYRRLGLLREADLKRAIDGMLG